MADPTIVREPAGAGSADVDVQRATDSGLSSSRDVVAVEEPLEIHLNGWRWLVTMRSPGDDADLIIGLLASEGVIGAADEVESIVFTRHPDEPDLANVADVRIASALGDVQRRLTRHQVLSTSSCGLCGKSAVEALLARQLRLTDGPVVDAAICARIPQLLADAQPVFRATGGLHAAALLDERGRLLAAREDIGRHNAVDKVLGWRMRAGAPAAGASILVVSGRASFEIVQKALAARIPIVAAVSAASSLAVTLARDANMTLVGFVRDRAYTAYTGAARLAHGRIAAMGGSADDALEFIPTTVRKALDAIACKISLADWQALTLDERRRLVDLAAGSPDVFGATLTTVVLARTGRAPRPLGASKPSP